MKIAVVELLIVAMETQPALFQLFLDLEQTKDADSVREIFLYVHLKRIVVVHCFKTQRLCTAFLTQPIDMHDL